MTEVKVNGQDWATGVPPGCASHHGHYVGKAVVQTALEAGWPDKEAVEAAAEYDVGHWRPYWRFFYDWPEIVCAAEDYLDSVTEGGIWRWADGDFRLVATAECPTCKEFFDVDDPGTCPDHPWWE